MMQSFLLYDIPPESVEVLYLKWKWKKLGGRGWERFQKRHLYQFQLLLHLVHVKSCDSDSPSFDANSWHDHLLTQVCHTASTTGCCEDAWRLKKVFWLISPYILWVLCVCWRFHWCLVADDTPSTTGVTITTTRSSTGCGTCWAATLHQRSAASSWRSATPTFLPVSSPLPFLSLLFSLWTSFFLFSSHIYSVLVKLVWNAC